MLFFVRIIISIIIIISASKILKDDRCRACAIFIAFLLLCDPAIVIVPGIPFLGTALTVALCTFVYKFVSQDKLRYDDGFYGKGVLTLTLLCCLAIGAHSEYLVGYRKISRPILDFLQSYFLLYVAYYYVKDETSFEKYYKPFLACFSLLCGYGVINYVLKANPYLQVVDNAFSLRTQMFDVSSVSTMFTGAERYRVNSLFNLAWPYGFFSFICIVIFTYCYVSVIGSKTYNSFMIVLGLFGSLFCYCRSVILAAFAGVGLLLVLNFKSQVRIGLIAFCAMIVSYCYVPAVQEVVDSGIDVFQTGGENLEHKGSTVDMRKLQMEASVPYFFKNPILGNGYDYFAIGLGWNEKDHNKMDEDLWGAESIVCNILLERGIVGMIEFISFWFLCIYLVFKYRKADIQLFNCTIAIIVAYLLFIYMNGEMNTTSTVIFVVGLNIAILRNKYHLL